MEPDANHARHRHTQAGHVHGARIGDILRTLAMALWLPLLFLLGLLFSYMVGLHQPVPHDVKIAVVAPAEVTERLQHKIDAAVPGGFDLSAADSPSEARSAVLQHEAAAAYLPDVHHPVLYGAKADGASMEALIREVFTKAGHKSGASPEFKELVPTASGDGLGTSSMYLLLACAVPAYFMVVTMQRATGFNRRAHVATIAGFGAVLAAICYFTAAYGMDVIPREPLALLYMFLLTQAVSLTTYGLTFVSGNLFPGIASTIFILLGVPSSGGALPVELVPDFFRFIHPILPMGNAMDAMRSVSYYPDESLTRPTVVLCVWIVGGALLILLGYVKWRRRVAREQPEESIRHLTPLLRDDPLVEAPAPIALVPHHHHLGDQQPMLTGRVTDSSGDPLPDVVVTVTDLHGHQLLRTRTDDDGEYAATGFSDGVAVVVASAPGREPRVTRLLLSLADPAEQDFTLPSRSNDFDTSEATL